MIPLDSPLLFTLHVSPILRANLLSVRYDYFIIYVHDTNKYKCIMDQELVVRRAWRCVHSPGSRTFLHVTREMTL